MRIRCGSCATQYQLDDSLLPPEGAPVQCTRCGHVFEARPVLDAAGPWTMPASAAASSAPPRPPEVPAHAPMPAAPRAAASATRVADAAPNHASKAAVPAPRPAARSAVPAPRHAAKAADPAPKHASKPTGPAPQHAAKPADPPPKHASSAADPAPRHGPKAADPVPKHAANARAATGHEAPAVSPALDDLDFPPMAAGHDAADPELLAFEHAMARRRKVVVGAVVGVLGAALLVGLGSIAWKELRSTSHDPAAVAKLDQLLAAIRSGDPAQALEAAPLGEEALAIEPSFRRARADRGLALLVAASERKDRADRVATKRAPIERALRKAEEAGDAAAGDELRKQLEVLKAEYDPLLAAYGKLKAEADEAIEGAYKGGGEDDAGAVRAMGILRAASGDEKNAPVLAKNYRKLAGDADGWADLIEGQLFAAGRASPEKRAQAVEKLTAALQRDPSLGIAYLLLGRVRLELQDFAGARKDLGQALAAGPGNELARRWLADVEVAAAPKPPPAPDGAAEAAVPGPTPAGAPAAAAAQTKPAATAGPAGVPAAG